MQNTQVITNEELTEALSSNEEITDPIELMRKLVNDMMVLIKAYKSNNTGQVSLEEINSQIVDKRQQMINNFMENKEEIIEHTEQIRESWTNKKGVS